MICLGLLETVLSRLPSLEFLACYRWNKIICVNLKMLKCFWTNDLLLSGNLDSGCKNTKCSLCTCISRTLQRVRRPSSQTWSAQWTQVLPWHSTHDSPKFLNSFCLEKDSADWVGPIVQIQLFQHCELIPPFQRENTELDLPMETSHCITLLS